MERQITGECNNCESHYSVAYVDEIVSEELPEYCPFCGSEIEEITEEFAEEEDDDSDTEDWD